MELKKENTRSPIRMKLSKTLREMNLSIGTLKKVSGLLKNMPEEQAEIKAGRILEVLTFCESEAEILEKIADL